MKELTEEELDIFLHGNIFDIAGDLYEVVKDENGNDVVLIKGKKPTDE